MNHNTNSSIKKIQNLDKVLIKVSEHYSEIKKTTISRDNIFDALYLSLNNRLNWENSLDFWDLEITIERAIEELNEFDFNTVLHTIETTIDLISAEYLMQYKVKIKSKGLIWHIHKYDADPFPSNPHAHEIDSGLKMDLSNGDCYKKTKFIKRIKKKELLIIRKEAEKNFNLPKLEL